MLNNNHNGVVLYSAGTILISLLYNGRPIGPSISPGDSYNEPSTKGNIARTHPCILISHSQ